MIVACSTGLVQSMHSRMLVVIFASTCECIRLYQSPYICFALLKIDKMATVFCDLLSTQTHTVHSTHIDDGC